MEHQYPVAITGDEHMLAELMLPDQAHVRNQDWTIFFLHKDTSQEEEEAELKAERRRRRKRRRDIAEGLIEPEEEDEVDEEHPSDNDSDSSDDSEPEGGEGPPLIYVLNLVNTKQDKTAKRGAVVKAMAICTRHPFLHIYKVSSSTTEGCLSTDYLALIIIGIGGILQGTTPKHTGNSIQCGEHNGSFTHAKTFTSGEIFAAVQRQQGSFCGEVRTDDTNAHGRRQRRKE